MKNKPTLLGLFLGLTLAVFILHKVLFSQGTIQSIDISIWYYFPSYRSSFFNLWNYYVSGDNGAFMSQYNAYLWFFLSDDPAIVQRVMYFFVFAFIGVSMFLTMFYWLEKKKVDRNIAYASSIVATLIYELNPWVTVRVFHWYFLLSYAFIPLIFYLSTAIIAERSGRKVIGTAIILGMLLALTQVHGSILSAFFLVFLLVSSIIFCRSRSVLVQRLRNVMLAISVVAITVLLLSSYWLLPFFLSFSQQYQGGAQWSTSVADVILFFSKNADILNAMTLSSNASWGSLFDPQWALKVLWLILRLASPLLASCTLVFRRNDKTVLTLAFLSVITIFLAKGANPPLGDFYLWLVFRAPGSSNYGWLLKDPYAFTMLLSFSYAFLASITTAEMIKKSRGIVIRLDHVAPLRSVGSIRAWSLAIPLIGLVVMSSAISAYPLLSGDLNGYIAPTPFPQSYRDANQWLLSQGGDGRVIWVPESSAVIWSPHGGTPKLDQWASSRPVVLYGWGAALSLPLRVYGNLVSNSLSNNETRNIGELLRSVGIRYIIFHNDTYDSHTYKGLYQNLLKANDLKLSFVNEYISIFENKRSTPYFYSLGKIIVTVGGLETLLSLSHFQGVNVSQNAFVFVEQSPKQLSFLENLLTLPDVEKVILFSGSKNLEDLILSTIGEEYYLAPSDYLIETYPLSPWIKEDFYSGSWTCWRIQSFGGKASYDFDLGRGIVFTDSPNAKIKFNFNLPMSNLYEVWARVRFTPLGGTLSISVDNNAGLINTYSDALNAFRWVRLSALDLSKGGHLLSIESKVGLNAINVLAIVPKEKMQQHTQELFDITNRSDVRLVHYETHGDLATPVDDVFSEVQLPYVLNYSKISPSLLEVEINASKPYLLVFSESYHEGWHLDIQTLKVPIFSVMNGFYVSKIGHYTVQVEYIPQRYLYVGTSISMLSIGFFLIALIFINKSRFISKRGLKLIKRTH